VEVLFASVFVLLYLMNLRAPFDQDLLKFLPRHQPAVWMLFVRNATVMSAVLTIALMRWDGLRVPTRFVAVTVLLVIALVAGTVLVLPRVDGSIPWEELGTRVGGVLLLVVLGWLSWQIIATFIYLIHQGRHPLSDCLLDTAGVVLASLVLSPLSLPIVAVIILIVSLSIPPRWRLVAWVVAMVTLFVIVYPDTILSPVN
jgi:hypothetical protein